MINHLRVVASYTTIPSRYETLQKSLDSLKNQTHKLDTIYLTIPKISRRLNKPYPPLPEDIIKSCTVVHSDIDYGPLTKIYGALVSETDPNTVIISCDDDVNFSPNHIETLLQYHIKYPHAAICGTGSLIGKGLIFFTTVSSVSPFNNWKGTTGFDVPVEGRCVDVIAGVAGVLYTRDMFPATELLHDELFNYALLDDAIFHNDDILISGYLSKQKIERRIFLDIPHITSLEGSDALSGNIIGMIMRMNESIAKTKEYGFFTTMEPYGYDETPAGRGFIAIFLLIIVIILCFYFYQS